jgi:integrase
MSLTDLQVKKMAPKSRRYEVFDGNRGLYIRILPSGVKAWMYRYSLDGVRRRMSFGQYPGVSLAQARTRYSQALQDLQGGIDPGAKQRETKAKRKAAPIVSELLDEFFEEELGKTPSGIERRRLIEKDVIPSWGKQKVADITRRDAVLLIDTVRKRAPVGASRLQSVMVRMWNFAAERGIIDFSPMVGMRRPKEKPKTRVLSNEEIKKLWAGLDLENTKIDMYRPTKLAIKMILLTGQRPGEVSDMRWLEIDEQTNTWTIPPERAKNRQEQRVPLNRMVIETLEQAKTFAVPNSDFVFPSSHKPKRALSRAALGKAIHRHWGPDEMGLDESFTPHDLRRTVRTRLAEIGVQDVIAERVLGHKLQGLMAVYNQHGYDTEKRQALALWEIRLVEILEQAKTKTNVIRFAPRGA